MRTESSQIGSNHIASTGRESKLRRIGLRRTNDGEEGERARDRREALLEELVGAQQRELEQQRERREVRLAPIVGHAARRQDVRDRHLADQRAVARLCAAKRIVRVYS